MSFLRAVAWVILIITGMLVILVTARTEAFEFGGIASRSTESFCVARGNYERQTTRVFTDAEVTSLVNRRTVNRTTSSERGIAGCFNC
jgi:hypothetical protein